MQRDPVRYAEEVTRAIPAFLALLAAGCALSYELPSDGSADGARIDAGADGIIRSCSEASIASDGTPCDFGGPCVGDGTCCSTSWSCVGSRLQITRTCTDACVRSCEDARDATEGTPCEGGFFCSTFDASGCCARSVECSAGRIVVDESCTPGCTP